MTWIDPGSWLGLESSPYYKCLVWRDFAIDATYRPREVEPRWQARWQDAGIGEVDLGAAKRPYYNLMMFPYPSAEGLHVGNVFAFTGADIHGRLRAMQGYDVFEPIGFDAFGIHSENTAIKQGIHPKALVAANTQNFRRQLRRMGGRFSWSHTLDSTDPAYYRWTQWIFLKLFEAGLAYRKQAPVNWCPSCRTVLADEQVISGHCERCDSVVEQRNLEQWFFRITAYADRLLDHLPDLDWSELIKTAQANWIGRSTGASLTFSLIGPASGEIEVFTTRPDTLYGATFLALAPSHPLAAAIPTAEFRPKVAAYIEQAAKADPAEIGTERAKTGVLTGAFARHPLTKEALPILVADYVLAGYGSGAVMGVPGHDQRDFDFAQALGLNIQRVVAASADDIGPLHEAFTDESGVLVNSGPYDGLSVAAAKAAITARAEHDGFGEAKTTLHLRDWLISRQRYWGPPIPVVYCDACGTVGVPEEELPVLLPETEDYVPQGTGASPLASIPGFVNTACPRCHGPARRETDVSDNFLCSSWYFLRYPSHPEVTDRPYDPELIDKWLPVDSYIGGREHAVLHLLYTRFICMALFDLGLLPFEEPFRRFRAHGTITFQGGKMSKSRGNVVTPDDLFDRYGADTTRLYLMFLGPYQEGGDYSERNIEGIWRFLQRVHRLVKDAKSPPKTCASAHLADLHRVVKRVTEDLEALKYNTAIAGLMEYNNLLRQRTDPVSHQELATFTLLLAPLAPHLAEELWQALGGAFSVHSQPFPSYDPSLLIEDTATVVVQVDGRVRARLTVSAGTAEAEVRRQALALDSVQRHLDGAEVERLVFVPDRLVNIVRKI